RIALDDDELHFAPVKVQLQNLIDDVTDGSRFVVDGHHDAERLDSPGPDAGVGTTRPNEAHVDASHLPFAVARSGCETIRCQSIPCRPSVCGVTWAGSITGTTTHASASSARAPPSRPTIPVIDAPTSRAWCMAFTRLTLMLRATSPPPTEKTNKVSVEQRRDR